MTREQSLILDFLRGGAALSVFFAHIQQILINPSWMPFSLERKNDLVPYLYSQLGAMGVMVFFVLSGYLIACSIMRNISDNPRGTLDIWRFGAARLNRLYPPLVLSQLLVLAIFGLIYLIGANNAEFFLTGQELYSARQSISFEVYDYIGAWLFLSTMFFALETPIINGPLWSLAHEFWFYVIAGLFALGIKRAWGLALAFCIVALIAHTRNTYFFYGLLVWSAGGLAALLGRPCILRLQGRGASIGIALISIVLCVCWIRFALENNYLHQYVFGVLFSVLLFAVLHSGHWTEWACKTLFVRYVAKCY